MNLDTAKNARWMLVNQYDLMSYEQKRQAFIAIFSSWIYKRRLYDWYYTPLTKESGHNLFPQLETQRVRELFNKEMVS